MYFYFIKVKFSYIGLEDCLLGRSGVRDGPNFEFLLPCIEWIGSRVGKGVMVGIERITGYPALYTSGTKM